jgi:hypothetical protein
MANEKERGSDKKESPNTDVVSLRLSPELARAFRAEAARRGKRRKALFEEMWELYKEHHRGSP